MMMITGIGDWTLLAWISSAVALIAGHCPQRTELEDLTYRCRHPVKWALEHPLKAIERMFR